MNDQARATAITMGWMNPKEDQLSDCECGEIGCESCKAVHFEYHLNDPNTKYCQYCERDLCKVCQGKRVKPDGTDCWDCETTGWKV